MATNRRSEVSQVGTFDVVEAQGPAEGLDHIIGDRGLAALLEAAVVIRAEPRQDCQLLFAKAGHTPLPGEGRDPGLGGRQPIAARAQEGSEGGTVDGHAQHPTKSIQSQPGHVVPRQRSTCPSGLPPG